MLKASKDVFRFDALGRLRLIAWLHDFEHIDVNIAKYKKELMAEKDDMLNYNPVKYFDMDTLTRDCFFPKICMTYSLRENPMDIIESLNHKHAMLRRELLLYQQLVEQSKLNEKQVQVMGGVMLRVLGQLPIENKLKYKLAQSAMEDRPAYSFFQKLLIL